MERLRRLFLAVPLDGEVAAILTQHLDRYTLPGRLVPPDNWHLTVRFLGNVDQLTHERLLAEIDQVDLGPSFEMELGDLGAFPRPARASVLWLALERGLDRLVELNGIAEEASQAVGLNAEERPFAPHLTLSRIRPEVDVRSALASYVRVPLRWTADALVLFQSHLARGGAAYEPIETFPLD